MNGRPFLFGEDLGGPAQERRRATDRLHVEAVAAAEAAGYGRGLAAGAAETERRRAEALERLSADLGTLIANADRRQAAIEIDGLAFFDALARKLAGRAIEAIPLGPVADAAAEAFRHLRGVPHLAARVHESLVEDVEALLRDLSRERGFEGRVVVIGSDDIRPGDARLEWADGGVASERAALEAAVEGALSAGRLAPSLHPERIP